MSAPPVVDPASLVAFWRGALADGVIDPETPLPSVVEAFGDSPEMADSLIELVVHGPKRATVASLAELEHDGAAVPEVGAMWIATDGAGRPRALIRTTEVRIGPLSSVDDAFAWDEGEGDRTRPDWLASHERYFARVLPTLGITFDPDMATVFERFEVLHRD
ncbi:MAG: ASCH domain-containing protein [Ilumatobacteraceae bacterium]